MFRRFGGQADAFHLACEYGPEAAASHTKLPSPVALARMELDWTSSEAETQVWLCGLGWWWCGGHGCSKFYVIRGWGY